MSTSDTITKCPQCGANWKETCNILHNAGDARHMYHCMSCNWTMRGVGVEGVVTVFAYPGGKLLYPEYRLITTEWGDNGLPVVTDTKTIRISDPMEKRKQFVWEAMLILAGILRGER